MPDGGEGPGAPVRDFGVPDLGEGLEDATIVEWLVDVGDQVVLNELVCILETQKAEVEIPSPFTGRVVERGGEVGDTLRVGSLLLRIEERRDATRGEPERANEGKAPSPSPDARREPVLVGYGTDADQDASRRGRRRSPMVGDPVARPLAKPPVRMLARSLGVDLAALVPGSGPDGIVTRTDVMEAAEAASVSGPSDVPAQVGSSGADEGDEVVPVQGVRGRIAEHLGRSRAEIPDATASVTVECTRMLEARERLRAEADAAGQPGVVTPFALLCRLLVLSLRRHRILNASFEPDPPTVRIYGAVHLGIGTATDRGLVVPVVRDAHRRTMLELAGEIGRLADGARAGTLAPAELTGSTFTVSNFGSLGLDDGVPVINFPEAAILGIGSIEPRPHVVAGRVVAAPTARLTCAFDHRVCDGAEVGAFMRHLRRLVEEPDRALLWS